jgi:hypothetical protein
VSQATIGHGPGQGVIEITLCLDSYHSNVSKPKIVCGW